jgi:hypothetical protein
MHASNQEYRTTIIISEHHNGTTSYRAETYGCSGQVCLIEAEMPVSANERRLVVGMAEQWLKLSEIANTEMGVSSEQGRAPHLASRSFIYSGELSPFTCLNPAWARRLSFARREGDNGTEAEESTSKRTRSAAHASKHSA